MGRAGSHHRRSGTRNTSRLHDGTAAEKARLPGALFFKAFGRLGSAARLSTVRGLARVGKMQYTSRAPELAPCRCAPGVDDGGEAVKTPDVLCRRGASIVAIRCSPWACWKKATWKPCRMHSRPPVICRCHAGRWHT